MISIGEYIRRHNRIVVLVLLMIGFALLWGSTHFEKSSESYILMINLGAAFIVTAIAILILTHTVEGIETTFEKEINELATKLDVLPEAKKCGIVHIFESRRKDPNYKKELIKQFERCETGEVLLMSISLRDFFGPRLDNEYLTAIFGMLKKGIKFKILLLDPTSEAAKDRALVEEKERVKNYGYRGSTLFTEIKIVAERLNNPSPDWIVDEELRKKIIKQIEVRFFPYDPTTQLIITEKFIFIEQYHRGGDKEIRKALEKEGIPSIDCFGGFVPVWMVENSAFFAKLMKSHFMNIWNSDDVKERDLRKNNYYQRILRFKENEKK